MHLVQPALARGQAAGRDHGGVLRQVGLEGRPAHHVQPRLRGAARGRRPRGLRQRDHPGVPRHQGGLLRPAAPRDRRPAERVREGAGLRARGTATRPPAPRTRPGDGRHPPATRHGRGPSRPRAAGLRRAVRAPGRARASPPCAGQPGAWPLPAARRRADQGTALQPPVPPDQGPVPRDGGDRHGPCPPAPHAPAAAGGCGLRQDRCLALGAAGGGAVGVPAGPHGADRGARRPALHQPAGAARATRRGRRPVRRSPRGRSISWWGPTPCSRRA